MDLLTTVLLLQMKDTAREGDGNRNLINQKLLVSVFKSLSAYSKYALETFISIVLYCKAGRNAGFQFYRHGASVEGNSKAYPGWGVHMIMVSEYSPHYL